MKTKRHILDKTLYIVKNNAPGKELNAYLKGYGFHLITARLDNAPGAMKMVDEIRPDIVIMDAGDLCPDCQKILRGIYNRFSLPLILISKKEDHVEAVLGLELGADACMAEPYDPRELVATMRAVLRRTVKAENNRRKKAKRMIESGGFTLDTVQRTIIKDGEDIKLTGMEYEILKVMMKNSNVILAPGRIMSGTWKKKDMHNGGSIRVHISSLRSKLGDDGRHPRLIKTVRGAGYVFVDARANVGSKWQNKGVASFPVYDRRKL